MALANMEYPKPFILEPTKLERLLDVMHELLANHPDTTIHDHFEVFMARSRGEQLKSLDEVLALENSKKYRIERLTIRSIASTPDSPADYEIKVDFGVVKPPKGAQPTSATAKMVTVDVRSHVPAWNRQVLSQVEEQVERTWLRQTTPILALGILVMLLLGFFLVQFRPVFRPTASDYAKIMWLDDDQLDIVEKASNENRPMTDAELRAVSTGQLHNVLSYERPKPQPSSGNTRLLLFFGIPFVLLVGVSLYLMLTSYPTHIFLWGDVVARYNAILQRRRVLWTVIVGILVVSIAGRLLAEGLFAWIPK